MNNFYYGTQTEIVKKSADQVMRTQCLGQSVLFHDFALGPIV